MELGIADAAEAVATAVDPFARHNDRRSVVDHLRAHGVLTENEPEPAFTPLTGGRSNLTYRFATERGALVLRRPPASHALQTAHDMGREYRIIDALDGSSVAVPPTLLLCEEEDVNDGVPFYVMGFVAGTVVNGETITVETKPSDREPLTGATIAQLARIHDPAHVQRPGIAALGRGDGYLERQVRRWSRQWAAATERSLPDADVVAHWLSANVPADAAMTLVHGDYRIDNCLYAPGDLGTVAAVVDWEMGTVGDPFTDLAMFLLYWVRPGDDPALLDMFPTANMSRHEGFPGRDWVLRTYEEAAGSTWTDERFYMALACFKLAAICEGIHARFAAGGTAGGDEFAGYDDRAATLMQYARLVVEGAHSFMQH